MKTALLALSALLLALAWCAERPDIVFADFEGPDYGDWRATGDAFGLRPAPGTLPWQKMVSGYHGTGLVNSRWGGDGSTGTLTSPPFQIERRTSGCRSRSRPYRTRCTSWSELW